MKDVLVVEAKWGKRAALQDNETHHLLLIHLKCIIDITLDLISALLLQDDSFCIFPFETMRMHNVAEINSALIVPAESRIFSQVIA